MPREVDHYKVLGVPRDADMDAVKLAYRKAALDYHPDNYDGDPEEAEKKLRELIVAYKSVARELNPSSWSTAAPVGRTFTPQDFAREGSAAVWQPTLEYFLPVQMCHMRIEDRYRVCRAITVRPRATRHAFS